jgi:hypothetical protein
MSSTIQWSIKTFLDHYEKGLLLKPRIQRKKRWTKLEMNGFLTFIQTYKNAVVPFLVNEVIAEGIKQYYIFDGNNRSNAILEFYEQPLSFDLVQIPKSFSKDLQTKLKSCSLEILLNRKLSFSKFCRDYECVIEKASESILEEAWQTMIEQLDAIQFGEIKLDMTIFPNLTAERMSHIYESINRTGVKLSKQELLASSTSRFIFTKATLTGFDELQDLLETKYYETMNSTEKLKIVVDSGGKLNLFEVLVAVQYKLHGIYPYFIPEPCSFSKETDLDMVFRLYKYITHMEFDITPTHVAMNTFISQIETACKIVDAIYTHYFNFNIPCSEIKKYLKVQKNVAILLIVYVIDATNHSISSKVIQSNLRRVILYHELMSTYKEKEEIRTKLSLPPDFIRYEAGGLFIQNQVQKIQTSHTFEVVPTKEQIAVLLKTCIHDELNESVEKIKRRPLTKVQTIALSVFYGEQIPSSKMKEPQNKDHIVPFSMTCTEIYDIHRLGNLQLISETLNKSRGVKPITDAWIEETGLIYQGYPKEAEYAEICDSKAKIIRNVKKYNEMCERRETKYIELILSTL